MPLSPVVNLYFDTTQYGDSGQQLLASLLSSTVINQIGMVAADSLTLNLWPRATSGVIGAPTTTVQLANPAGLMISAKPYGSLEADTLLFDATGFAEETDTNGNYYYTASLNLDKSQLLAALGAANSLPVLIELENVGTSFGEQRFQFSAVIYPPVYLGTEGLPTSALPQYWTNVQSDARYLRADSGLSGSAVLAAGQSSYTAAGLALPFLPATVLAWIDTNGGTPEVIAGSCDRSTITLGGFTINFTGLTTDAAHVINWLCLPAPGAYTNGNPAVPPTAQDIVVAGAAAAVALQIPGLIRLDLTAATGQVALTLTNPVTGGLYVFEVLQGATPQGIAFPANTKQKGGGGNLYTPSGANLTDLIRMTYDGTNYLISVEDNYA